MIHMYKVPTQLLLIPITPSTLHFASHPSFVSSTLQRRMGSSLCHGSSICLSNALNLTLVAFLLTKPLAKAPSNPFPKTSINQNMHLRSTWQISVPSLLFAQLPTVCPLSSFGERRVQRPRGICYSCWMQVISEGRRAIEVPDGEKEDTYVRPDAFHANAIVRMFVCVVRCRGAEVSRW